jgi:tetratricopeptide (TPR) repeat protein
VRCAVAALVVALAGVAAGDEAMPEAEREQRTRALVADGLNRFNVGEYDEAAKRFTQAYVLQPLPELLYDLAQIAAKQGRHEKAIELYRRYANTLSPSAPQARVIEAKIDGLRQTLAQETPQQQAARRLRLGRGLVAHGRLDDAQEELDGGYALDPLPTFLVALGDLAQKRNDKATAIDHYRGFLAAAAPDDPERAYARAQLDALQPAPSAPPPEPRHSRKQLWWLAAPAAVVVTGVIVGIYFGATANSSSVPQIPVSLH